jgi:hypothetical protein
MIPPRKISIVRKASRSLSEILDHIVLVPNSHRRAGIDYPYIERDAVLAFEAHILIAFLAYCLWVCLKQKLHSLGGSLTSAQVPHTLKQILMVEVWFDLRRGGQICLPRITQPEAPAQLILHRLGWSLPEQPPPRIYRDQSLFVGQPEPIGAITGPQNQPLMRITS